MAVYVTKAMLSKFHKTEYAMPVVYEPAEAFAGGDHWDKIASDR